MKADGFMHAAISRASGNGTVYYTENQLFGAAQTLHLRKIKKERIVIAIFLAVILFGVSFVFFTEFGIAALLVLPFILFLMRDLASLPLVSSPYLERKHWDRAVANWRKAEAPFGDLLSGSALTLTPPEAPEEDIYSYGVEKILICQRRELVDVLVLNGFHCEQGCLVISEDGYPSYLMPHVRAVLLQEEVPKVFLWHDACREGERMLARVKAAGVFDLNGCEVYDLGIGWVASHQSRNLRGLTKANGGHLPADIFRYRKLSGMLSSAMAELLTVLAIDDARERRTQANTDGGVLIWETECGSEYSVDWGGGDGEGDGDGE